MSLLTEVLLHGVFWAYLIFLFPAAVVTALKDRWLFLSIGFFTCGLLWVIGACDRPKEGSWWARRFRAGDPEEGSREFELLNRRRVWRTVIVSVLTVLLIGAFTARPAPILGVDGETLQYEIGGPISFEQTCGKRDDGDWTCYRYDDEISGDRPYRVSVDSFGCWTAELMGDGKGGGLPSSEPELSGCITIASYLEPFDLIL